MGKFRFQAVNEDGKRLSGTVSASTLQRARAKLTDNGYAVLDLAPYVAPAIKNANQKLFLFGIQMNQGVVQKGTIQATNEYEAYEELRSEYDFAVTYLYPQDLPLEEIEARKDQGINPAHLQRWEKESKKTKIVRGRKVASQITYDKIVSKHQKEIDELGKQITHLIKTIAELLKQTESFLNPEKKRDIIQKVDLLARIKHSNSIDHLKTVTRKILEELADDAFFLEESKLTPEQKLQLAAERNKFKDLVTSLGKSFTKALEKIELPLVGIDTAAVKKTVLQIHQELNPLQSFGEFLYWMFSFLFVFFLLFWCLVGFYFFLSDTPELSLFYLQSRILWFLTAFTAFVFLVFSAPVLISNFRQKCRRSFFWTAVVLLFLILVFAFPLLFPWTR